jgi:hypothetical protein
MYGYSLSAYSILALYIYNYCISPIRLFFTKITQPVLRLFYSSDSNPKEPVVVVSPTDQYVQTQTTRFLKTFDEEFKSIDYNSSIDPVFYSKKELSELLKDEANTLEPKWRTKILFENTPRGNIVMFYDAFKQGFAYYTDQTGIPYPILNAAAMKYVIMFRCRDFFMDEHVLPENTQSGIIARYAEEERAEKEKKQAENGDKAKTKEKSVGNESKAAFAKFKSYNSVSSKTNGYTPKSSENVLNKSKEEQTTAPKLTNKHISLGKMTNFSFTQKPVIKRTPTVESALLPKPRLSYADYKRISGETLLM